MMVRKRLMFEEGGEQFVIKEPPTTVDQMTSFLLGYLAGPDAWKKKADWS